MGERGKSGIYAIVNKVNGKRYVGQAASIGDRWLTHRSHLSCGRHHSSHLQRAWAKYGTEAFEFAVLEYVDADKSRLAEREQYWFDVFKPEYNVAPAAATCIGLKHPPRSEEFKQKMREQRIGFRHTAETKDLIRKIAAEKMANGTMYRPTAEHREKLRTMAPGLLHTPEAIEKRRKTMTGRKQSPEQIAKRVQKLLGHSTSDYTKQRIAEVNRARLLGTKQTPELIERRVATLRGRPRPQHVVSAMHDALRLQRQPTIDAIKLALAQDPNLNQTKLAAALNCGRATIRKYRRQMLEVGAQP